MKKITKIKNFYFVDNRQQLSKILLNKVKFKTREITITKSIKNSFRGLHYQIIRPQSKIVYVIKGSIIDIAINIDKHSKDYLKVSFNKLDEKSNSALYIPKKYAHGYLSTKDSTVLMLYNNKTNTKYSKTIFAKNFLKNLNICWENLIISEKDKNANNKI